jgi:hypothetical protein
MSLACQSLLLFGDLGEDLGGVAFSRGGIPDFFDFAVGADQKRAADNAHIRLAEKFFHAVRAVSSDRFLSGITEKIEVEFSLGLELGLRGFRIAAESENHHIQPVEVLLCVTKLGRFGRSTGSIGFRVEEKNDALS